MRLKAEMEALNKEVLALQREALKNGEKSKAEYYEGIRVALSWVQDKKNENTNIYYS